MLARNVMSSPVVVATPRTTVTEIATLLIDRRISGVPVVANRRVVGIVSEGDLVRRPEIGTERDAHTESWWRRWLFPPGTPAAYVATHALYAADIMNRDVVTVTEATPLAEIVALFERHRVRRVPVLHGGTLSGIVTRADLVKAFASTVMHDRGPAPDGDEEIRARLLAELVRQPWWHRQSVVTVEHGVVRYSGVMNSADEVNAARVAAENISGVRRVEDHRFPLDAIGLF